MGGGGNGANNTKGVRTGEQTTGKSKRQENSLCQWRFQTRILDSGWIQGICADILSHTWPVRGGDQPRTTPMLFQRVSTDFCGSPDHPRRAETAERATWGTKTPPRPPTASTPPAPARVRRKPRRWDPLVPIWGGSPVAAPRPLAPLVPSLYLWQTPRPLFHTVGKPNPASRHKQGPWPAELVT
jgi:hypothetical protein